MKRILVLSIFCLFAASDAAHAVNFTLPNLINQSDVDKIVSEFSANTAFTSASPPSHFGKKILPWLGFEFGAVGGETKSPDLAGLVSQADATQHVDNIYHVGVLLGFDFPYGLGVESTFIPKTTVSGISLSYTGLAAKWTVTDVFWEWLPVEIAIKANWAKATVDFGETINNSSTLNQPIATTIELQNSVWGVNASVGTEFFGFLEPYVGAGFLLGNGSANVLGSSSATIFTGLGFSGVTQTASSSPSSGQIFAGLQFNIFVLNISAEAMRAFGTNNYTAKFSFNF